MNKTFIAKELLLIAKSILDIKTAGGIDVPPKMYEDISIWIDQTIASTKIFNNNKIKKFKIDLEGWKYKSLVKTTPIKEITVILEYLQMGHRGQWEPDKNTLRLYVKEKSIKDVLYHELQHFCQTYLEAATKKKFGLPSPTMLNKDIKQKRFLRDDDNNDHALDDHEFYPELKIAIAQFGNAIKNFPKLTKKDMSMLLSKYVDEDFNLDIDDITKNNPILIDVMREPSFFDSGISFFAALKRRSKPKWKKAVSEIFKTFL